MIKKIRIHLLRENNSCDVKTESDGIKINTDIQQDWRAFDVNNRQNEADVIQNNRADVDGKDSEDNNSSDTQSRFGSIWDRNNN